MAKMPLLSEVDAGEWPLSPVRKALGRRLVGSSERAFVTKDLGKDDR
jgi:hypothetical protein